MKSSSSLMELQQAFAVWIKVAAFIEYCESYRQYNHGIMYGDFINRK